MVTRIQPGRLAALARRDLGGPLDVVNLISTARFERYRWYGLLVLPALAAVGARVVWMGRFERSVAGQRQADKLLIVRYPTHRHFLAMTLNPYYLAINRLRESGVRRFEASFTEVSSQAPDLSRRRVLVVVHFRSPAGRDALGDVATAARPVAGDLVYATRAVAGLDFLDPPRETDPSPLRLGEVAMFAPPDGEPAGDGLAGLAEALAPITGEFSLQVYRRESRSAYRPSVLPAPPAQEAEAA